MPVQSPVIPRARLEKKAQKMARRGITRRMISEMDIDGDLIITRSAVHVLISSRHSNNRLIPTDIQ